MAARFSPRAVILSAVAVGVLWSGWRAVPRPAHAIRSLAPAAGCPRPVPSRVEAPAELSAHERCVLLWSSFELLPGVDADTAAIRSVTIEEDRWFPRRGSLFPHPFWTVEIWTRSGQSPVWIVAVSRHDGRRTLLLPHPSRLQGSEAPAPARR